MLTTKLTNIANAIRNKTQTSVAMTLDEMPSKIEGISTAENLTEELNTYNNGLSEQETTIEDIMEALKNKGIGQVPKYAPRYIKTITFQDYTGTELDYEIANLDTTNLITMNYMFGNCRNLTNLDLSSFNTSNVTSMSSTFSGCSKLTSLDLSNFNTSNVISMSSMFSGCSKLTSLDLSNFNTSNVTSMTTMFQFCSVLTDLDLSNFNTSNVTSMTNIFYSCTNLTNLDIRNFDFAKVTNSTNMFNGVPTDCLIIVKDETAKEWITSKFTDLTNVKTVAEL